jgi:hypothetical protein
VSSIEPYSCSDEVDSGEKVSRRLVITGSNGSELLEFRKEILNPVALFIKLLIQVTFGFATLFRGDDHLLSRLFQRSKEAFVRVACSVGEHGISGNFR